MVNMKNARISLLFLLLLTITHCDNSSPPPRPDMEEILGDLVPDGTDRPHLDIAHLQDHIPATEADTNPEDSLDLSPLDVPEPDLADGSQSREDSPQADIFLSDEGAEGPDYPLDLNPDQGSAQDLGLDVLSDTSTVLDSTPPPADRFASPDGEDLFAPDITDRPRDTLEDSAADSPGDSAADLGPTWPPVVLNEVDCRGNDWAELFNPSDLDMDLSGWVFTDDTDDPSRGYVLPPGTVIPAKGWLVLHEGTDDAPGFDFGIGCGNDTLWILHPDGSPADSIALPELAEELTWGRLPDGDGPWQATGSTPGAANTAPRDDAAFLFDPFQVFTIDITLDQDAIDSLNQQPKSYVQAGFQLTAADGTVHEPMEVGTHLKGSFSFQPLSGKAQFKIKFDYVEPDGRFLGLKHIVVNNMIRDPSMIHEPITYSVFRAVGVPCPRVGYAWVRVNGEDYGLYAHVESYDGVSLGRHFPSTQHLYEGPGDIHPGSEFSLEVDEGDPNNRDDLSALIAVANGATDGEWMAQMSTVADLDEMITMWAGELYVNQWDGYACVANNYYLHSDADSIFTMLPWGVDLTWQRSIPFHEGSSVLFSRCMAIAECREAYDLSFIPIAAAVDELSLETMAADLASYLQPWVEADPRKRCTNEQVATSVQGVIDLLAKRRLEAEALITCALDPTSDVDGDGYGCRDDCNTEDPTIHPNAEEICGDGIDQDCNGRIDDGELCDCTTLSRGTHRYLICTHRRDYQQSRSRCQGQGMDMVILDSPEEELWVQGQLSGLVTSGGVWIGLSDMAEEGAFVWWDGSAPAFTHWNEGQPDNNGQGEDCTTMEVSRGWYDVSCRNTFPVLCEEICLPGQDDADEDGYSACGLDCDDNDPNINPSAEDICGDGIDQNCNGLIDDGTVDSDGDGIPCGSDCDDSDPLIYPGATEVCDDAIDQDCNGLVDDGPDCCITLMRGDHRYLACGYPRPFDDAREHCLSRGSDLIVLNSPEEENWVRNTALPALSADLWLGLTDSQSEGAFLWVDGSSPSFTSWMSGEPSDPGGEDCVVMHASGGWSDEDCWWTWVAPLCEDPCVLGQDDDRDQDGFSRCSEDCDDQDPLVNPLAPEICGDGIDQDCNGQVDDGPDCLPCPLLVVGEISYGLCVGPRSWEQALSDCQSQGASLAWFSSLAEEEAAIGAARELLDGAPESSSSLWIGLNDRQTEGRFVWPGGSPATYTHWAPGEPEGDGEGARDCVEIIKSGLWADKDCSMALTALCRWR